MKKRLQKFFKKQYKTIENDTFKIVDHNPNYLIQKVN
ncbi:hypothetical protein C8N46_101511 [Kordia periserrulae]|uniref:Uncharacterized protein n=1 Tax=Kordia periserrulae TaxID=701523 RepID=A0A2T6C6G4_9FLAO|nr:hypothetical protein C8N46_101511 [Kordia periserrulae]